MAKQTINLGTPPTGVGGDTSRSGVAKLQANDDELYTFLGAADGTLTAEKAKAVMNIAGHAFYKTLALAQAAQASLPANTIVEVTNDGTNNGTYQWNGTTLTKAPYDTLELAKQYSNQKQVVQEQYINDLFAAQTQNVENLINQQGVSLQQLDDYYNYLMQRLAQIAVDKGWDASFVVDESGKNQQQINNNLNAYHIATSKLSMLNFMPQHEIPNNGLDRADVLIQQAVNEIHQMYLIDGVPRQLVLPFGAYRLEANINWKPGVGLVGDGIGATRLIPFGPFCGIYGNQAGSLLQWFSDCHFADFSVYGENQTIYPPAESWVKGIFIQFMKNSSFTRVESKDTLWTGFGLDYLDDVTLKSCKASGAGRGVAGTKGAGAGFGIATGYSQHEKCVIDDCDSYGNRTHGFFTENKYGKDSSKSFFSRRFELKNSRASRNQSGFCDAGSDGAQIIGNNFSDNKEQGVLLGLTPANTSSGINGLLALNTIERNGAEGGNAAGVFLAEMRVGGYTITDNEINDNRGAGISGGSGFYTDHAVLIKKNRIERNDLSAVRIVQPDNTKKIKHLTIFDNDMNDNVRVSQEYDDAIQISACLEYPIIQQNRGANTTAGGGQMRRLVNLRNRLGVVNTTVEPVITDNIGTKLLSDTVFIGHTVADTTNVVRNIKRGVPTVTYNWSDTFTQNVGIVSGRITETGDKTWTVNGSGGTPEIVNGAIGCPTWTASISRAYVNNGAINGTFSAKCVNVGSTKRARLIFRLTNPADGSYEIVGATTTSNNWTLGLRTSAGFTTVADLGVVSANNDVIEVIMSNDSLTIKINGSQKYLGVMTDHLSATACGFAFTETEARWDDVSFV